MNKRGQVTIFLIIGLIILVAGILIYLFVPGIKSSFSETPENPNIYLQNCIQEDLGNLIQQISLQGGTLEPKNYYLFEESKVYYSCYSSGFYENCIVQAPFLKEDMERELTEAITPKINECFNSLKESYEKSGYSVTMGQGKYSVKILPKGTNLEMNRTINVFKKDSTRYETFNILINNNLYQVVGVVRSIINGEAYNGQIETTIYMELYPNLKIEKLKQGEGTNIYKITTRDTNEVFNVASRSLAFPPGLI